MIALGRQVKTEAEEQAVAELLASRLDGALAWSMANANKHFAPAVIEKAIDLRLKGVPAAEQSRLRGLSLEGYTPGLTEIAEPAEEISDETHLRQILTEIPKGQELTVAYRLADQTRGRFQSLLANYLAEHALQSNDWTPLLEEMDSPQESYRGELVRQTFLYLYRSVPSDTAVMALSSALRWAIGSKKSYATWFFLSVLEMSIDRHPTQELWGLAPVIKEALHEESRQVRLQRLWGIVGEPSGNEHRYRRILATMQSRLPDSALPQPAEAKPETTHLPRPVPENIVDSATLPTPATGELRSASDSKWKQWTKRLKR